MGALDLGPAGRIAYRAVLVGSLGWFQPIIAYQMALHRSRLLSSGSFLHNSDSVSTFAKDVCLDNYRPNARDFDLLTDWN